MKKVMLLLVVIFGIMSCHDKSVQESKLSLLSTTSHLSSLNYHVEIKRYLIKHQTISFEALDSIRKTSDKRCDSILSSGVEKVY